MADKNLHAPYEGLRDEPYEGLPVSDARQLGFPLPEFGLSDFRVYPLSSVSTDFGALTEEEMAVVFAMTSRRSERFQEIARQVTAEKAADFHERWVLGYGHASVAEHAVIHMAVEDISRLTCDSLEDNRLASFTEKSSRYQVLPRYSYYLPQELERYPQLKKLYQSTSAMLFDAYDEMITRTMDYLPEEVPQAEGERDPAYRLRLRRQVTDSCRFLLPAATLTNVGLTANARSIEHLIQKLLSGDLVEELRLGNSLKLRAREITPTLVKYADRNDYLAEVRGRQFHGSVHLKKSTETPKVDVRLVHRDHDAEKKLATALYYRYARSSYEQVWNRVEIMSQSDRRNIIGDAVKSMGPHDAPPREFEVVDFTFELTMDYGALREFKRHRMQTYIPQPLTVENGYLVPPLIERAGLRARFEHAMGSTEAAYRRIARDTPHVAQYLVTHAHNQRVLSKLNLRECYHLFQLRTQPQAHFSIREPIEQAMRLAVEAQPELFRYLHLRQYPSWWRLLYLDEPQVES